MAEKNTPPMAKVSTHTPGPWKAEPNGNIIASNLWVLASIDRFPSPDVNSKANAELIAAAPELLEALERSLVNSELFLESLIEDDQEIALRDDLGDDYRGELTRAIQEDVENFKILIARIKG
jgi:hypothetical protein